MRTLGFMNAEMLQIFIPIVAILAVFGFPVALIFTLKWYKLKDRELQLEADYRKTSGQALESRVQRLESIILALDADVRSRLDSGQAPRSELFEAPATGEGSQPGGLLEGPKKVR
jgi:Tfp pilus assembly protein FimT